MFEIGERADEVDGLRGRAVGVERDNAHPQRPHEPRDGATAAPEAEDGAGAAAQLTRGRLLVERAPPQLVLFDEQPLREGEDHGEHVFGHGLGPAARVAGDSDAGRERRERHMVDPRREGLDQERARRREAREHRPVVVTKFIADDPREEGVGARHLGDAARAGDVVQERDRGEVAESRCDERPRTFVRRERDEHAPLSCDVRCCLSTRFHVPSAFPERRPGASGRRRDATRECRGETTNERAGPGVAYGPKGTPADRRLAARAGGTVTCRSGRSFLNQTVDLHRRERGGRARRLRTQRSDRHLPDHTVLADGRGGRRLGGGGEAEPVGRRARRRRDAVRGRSRRRPARSAAERRPVRRASPPRRACC